MLYLPEPVDIKIDNILFIQYSVGDTVFCISAARHLFLFLGIVKDTFCSIVQSIPNLFPSSVCLGPLMAHLAYHGNTGLVFESARAIG